MAYIYGKKYTKSELLKRVGDISQIAQIKRYKLTEGNESQVEAIDINTGTGFSFTVLPGRGMDISYAQYCGKPLCWRSSTGDVNPSFLIHINMNGCEIFWRSFNYLRFDIRRAPLHR